MAKWFYLGSFSALLLFFLFRLNRERIITPFGSFFVPGDILRLWHLFLPQGRRRHWREIGEQSLYLIFFLVPFGLFVFSFYQLIGMTVPLVQAVAHGLSKSLILSFSLGILLLSVERDR